jgi:hypothetical protein
MNLHVPHTLPWIPSKRSSAAAQIVGRLGFVGVNTKSRLTKQGGHLKTEE